jgi:predicted AlkP superfamily phosphohydrolase/phosphomutase
MNKVLMIGLDGATFTVLKPLMEAGVMPFLKQFVSTGVHGDLMSTDNPLTPPAWVSMYTGRSPEVHGIFDFLRPRPSFDGNIVLYRPNDFRDIRCETVWSMATRQKKRVTSLNFFGMSPPFPVDGYVISGFTTWKHLRSATHPSSLLERLKTLPGFDYKKLGMDVKEEKKAIWGLQEGKHEGWIKMHCERDKAWTDLLCYLMETDPTDLTAIAFDSPDKLQHLFWRHIYLDLVETNLSAWDALIHELCLDFYRQLDSAIERIVSLASPETNVIITSDHGFGSTTEVVYINEWLSQHGYLKWSERAEMDTIGRISSDTVKDNRAMFDWDNTLAYSMTASSSGIFVRKADGSGVGVKEEDYAKFCTQLQQQLLEYRNPADGGQIFVNVHLNQAKIEGNTALESAPDITFKLRDGGFASILKSTAVVIQRKKPEGTHRPNGIFIARGPDVESGQQVNPLSILDITPLLLYFLDLPIPTDLEGRVPTEILRAETLMSHPVKRYGVTESLHDKAKAQHEEVADDQKEALLAQLKLLGYMD